jgi:tetratricopeptide (TPR) repeat protein
LNGGKVLVFPLQLPYYFRSFYRRLVNKNRPICLHLLPEFRTKKDLMRYFSAFVLFIFIAACSGKREGEIRVAWSPKADSLLRDTTPVNYIVDSLKLQTLYSENDSMALVNLYKLGGEWGLGKSTILSDEVKRIAEQSNSTFGKALISYNKGIAFFRESKWDSSEIKLSEAKHTKPFLDVSSYHMRGEIRRMTGSYAEAEVFYDTCFSIAQQEERFQKMANCRLSLADIYRIQGNYKGADSLVNLARAYLKRSYHPSVNCFANIIKAGIFRAQAKYDSALFYYNLIMKDARLLKDPKKIAFGYNATGDVYRMENNYPEALTAYSQCLDVLRTSENKYQEAMINSSMGSVYFHTSDMEKSIYYFERSLKLAGEVGDKNRQGFVLNYLAQAESKKKDFTKALACSDSALEKGTWLKDRNLISFSLDTKGVTLAEMGNYDSALAYFKRSYIIAEQINDVSRMVNLNLSMANSYSKTGKRLKEKEVLLKAHALAKSTNTPDNLSHTAYQLYLINEREGNFKDALEMHKEYVAMKDTVSSSEQVKKFASIEYKAKENIMKAEQEKENANHKLEQEKNELEIRKQKTTAIAVGAGLLLMIVFSFFIYRSLQRNRKQTKIIREQKEEAELQRHIIQEKQDEIVASITYARRIQRALITNEKYIQKSLDKMKKN